MNAKEIEIVDTVYRSYYNAYQKNQMIGIIDVVNQTGLTLEEVETSILFLEAEEKIKVDNKGFDPIGSGIVYKLTKPGYAWFAKTCYVDELIKNNSHYNTISEYAKFNVYINGSNGSFNLLDIDEAQLNIIIDAFLNGKPQFTLIGQCYNPKIFHTLKIFENKSNKNSEQLRQIGLENGGQKGFNGRFFTINDLKSFGSDVTATYIGNSAFGINNVGPISTLRNAEIGNQSEGSRQASTPNEKVFISYSWDSKEHQQNVLSFAGLLRNNGFEADLDMTLSQEETAINFVKMMHLAFSTYSKVIVVLSEGYKMKAESFSGGVGEEYQILIVDIKNNPKKYILVSFNGRGNEIVPIGLGGRDIVDLSVENGKDKVFRKLMNIPEVALPHVSKKRPHLETTNVEPFSIKPLAANPIKTTIEEKAIKEKLRKKKALERDFSPWLAYKKEDVKKRFRMIIHSIIDDTYPEQDLNANNFTWFGAEIYGINHLGLEFCNENMTIYINEKGNWTDTNEETIEGLLPINVSVIKTIAFRDIIEWDMKGDGIYNCPHFYVRFTNGNPWSEIEYVDIEKKYNRFDKSNKQLNT